MPECRACHRTLVDGEQAWADDWKVIDVSGQDVKIRVETRYTCDPCQDAS